MAGFGNMEVDKGYLDRLYVHPLYQRRGVATALCDALEAATASKRLVVQACLTARLFFEGRGYQVVRQQQVLVRGCFLTNFVMEKTRE